MILHLETPTRDIKRSKKFYSNMSCSIDNRSRYAYRHVAVMASIVDD